MAVRTSPVSHSIRGGLLNQLNKVEIFPLGNPKKSNAFYEKMDYFTLLDRFDYMVQDKDAEERFDAASLQWFKYFKNNYYLVTLTDNNTRLKRELLNVMKIYDGQTNIEFDSNPEEVELKVRERVKPFLQKFKANPDDKKWSDYFTEAEIRWFKASKIPESEKEPHVNQLYIAEVYLDNADFFYPI